jgi:ribosomal protein L30E
MTDAATIRKLIEEQDVFIGTKETLKGLKQGTISQVFMASNINNATRESIEHYSKDGVLVTSLAILNDELGTVCKKAFSISVLSVKK